MGTAGSTVPADGRIASAVVTEAGRRRPAVEPARGHEERDDRPHPHDPTSTNTVEPADGLTDGELELLCDAAVNHGRYGSAVARDRHPRDDSASPHGHRVSEAAKWDCGRTDSGDAVLDTPPPTEVGPTDGRPAGPGRGSGRSHGHREKGS